MIRERPSRQAISDDDLGCDPGVLLDQLCDSNADSARTRAAARLMSMMENEPARVVDLYRAAGERNIDPRRLHPRLILGVTGAPGSGKSTLIDALIAAYRIRDPNLRIGVIAVDPSSPFAGGALLGDRVRLMRHATDPNVFVRSLASRGHLGGLSLGVKGVMHVMALTGCDLVIIETVGVGQSEVEVATAADIVAVVLSPGQGDSVQLLKAGLLEVGDLFVVNKADRPEAAGLYNQLLSTLSMFAPNGGLPDGDTGCDGTEGQLTEQTRGELDMRVAADASVFLVSSTENTGIVPLIEEVERRVTRHDRRWAGDRERAMREETRQAVLEVAKDRLVALLSEDSRWSERLARILAGELATTQAAALLLAEADLDAGPPDRRSLKENTR